MEKRVAGVVVLVLLAATVGWSLAVSGVAADEPAPDEGDSGTTTSASTDQDTGALGGDLTRVGVVVALMAGIAGGMAWYIGVGRRPEADGTATTDSTTTETAATSEPTETGTEDQTAATDDRSDEDRVLDLLEENGGRMKQTEIVENTDWSKSKVSMVLSEMESDDEISKLRVGRENLVSISGEEPEAAGSPFEGVRE